MGLGVGLGDGGGVGGAATTAAGAGAAVAVGDGEGEGAGEAVGLADGDAEAVATTREAGRSGADWARAIMTTDPITVRTIAEARIACVRAPGPSARRIDAEKDEGWSGMCGMAWPPGESPRYGAALARGPVIVDPR